MKTKHLLILLAFIGAIVSLFFLKDIERIVGGGAVKLSFGKQELPIQLTFSVIRFEGKAVSAVNIADQNSEIVHFLNVNEEQLKDIMGIESYFNNKNFIEEYRRMRIQAMYLPNKGPFIHKIEKRVIKLE